MIDLSLVMNDQAVILRPPRELYPVFRQLVGATRRVARLAAWLAMISFIATDYTRELLKPKPP